MDVLGFVTGVGRIFQEICKWNGFGRMFYFRILSAMFFYLLSPEYIEE